MGIWQTNKVTIKLDFAQTAFPTSEIFLSQDPARPVHMCDPPPDPPGEWNDFAVPSTYLPTLFTSPT